MEECEMLRADSLTHDLDIEGEFVTEQTMKDWGWSEFFNCVYSPKFYTP